jgi:hypothetical protein
VRNLVKVSSIDTIAEIITMWYSQGYNESEIYRMLTAWDISINEEIISQIDQKLKDFLIRKNKIPRVHSK